MDKPAEPVAEPVILAISDLSDVTKMVECALRNGYEVTVCPKYEAYWREHLDHYDMMFIKVDKS